MDVTETAINWDHDSGEIYICTRKKAIVTKLTNLGFKPIRSEVHGYTTFKVKDKLLKLSFRAPKKMSAAQKKAAGDRLKKARATRAAEPEF